MDGRQNPARCCGTGGLRIDQIGPFLLAAFALTGSPGPNTLSAAAVGASFGRKRGLPFAMGLCLGVALVLIFTGSGVAAAIFTLPSVAPVITLLAAVYFIYLAFRIATAPPLGGAQARSDSQIPRWYEGVAITLANPKAYAAMGALVSGYTLVPTSIIADLSLKAVLTILVVCVVNFGWLSFGAWLSKVLRSESTAKRVNFGFAILLLLSVGLLALT
ncbi:MAG: LysE family translocator [Pseudomonadota bacterium]